MAVPSEQLTKFFSTTSATNQDARVQAVKKVGTFLENLHSRGGMRVYIPNTMSYGHQTTTVRIVRRMIEMGLKTPSGSQASFATVEIIFDDTTRQNETESNLIKIEKLLPEINIKNPYSIFLIETCRLRLIARNPDNWKPPEEKREFGITGGTETSPSSNNFAKLTNVGLFLCLQPYLWDQLNGTCESNRPDANQFTNFEHTQEVGGSTFKCLAYFEPLPHEPTDADWGLLKKQFDQEKVDAVKAVLDRLDWLPMCPVYGINAKDNNGRIPQLSDASQSQIVFNLIAGVRLTQDQALPKLKCGALVVMLSSLCKAQKDILRNLFQGQPPDCKTPGRCEKKCGVPDKCTPQLARFARESMRDHVEFVDYKSSKDLDKKLDELRTSTASNRVLILELGKITNTFFNIFYMRNTLPSVFEGMGTLNFAVNAGRPFLRLHTGIDQNMVEPRNTYPKGQLEPWCPGEAEAFCQRATQVLTTATANHWEYALKATKTDSENMDISDLLTHNNQVLTPAEWVKNCIQYAYKEQSPIAKYFDSLQKRYHTLDCDKLMVALIYTVDKYFQSGAGTASARPEETPL